MRADRAATPTAGEAAPQSAAFRSTDLSAASLAERTCMNAAGSNIQGQPNASIERKYAPARAAGDAAPRSP